MKVTILCNSIISINCHRSNNFVLNQLNLAVGKIINPIIEDSYSVNVDLTNKLRALML